MSSDLIISWHFSGWYLKVHYDGTYSYHYDIPDKKLGMTFVPYPFGHATSYELLKLFWLQANTDTFDQLGTQERRLCPIHSATLLHKGSPETILTLTNGTLDCSATLKWCLYHLLTLFQKGDSDTILTKYRYFQPFSNT